MTTNQKIAATAMPNMAQLARRGPALGILCLATAFVLAGCAAAESETQTPAPASVAPSSVASVAPETAVPESGLSAQAQAELDQRLVRAAKANDADEVRELIAAGGDVNAKDSLQDSAFLYAGAEGFNEILELTLEHGADVESLNRYGGTALIPASEHGHVETVKMLIEAGVPLDHVNNPGWTALHEAVLLGDGGPNQQEVARLLLAAGADPGITDPQGRTALENARRLGFDELAEAIAAHQ